MTGTSLRGRLRPAWPSVAVGVVVGVVLVAGFGPTGLLLPRVTACRLGAAVGNYTIWTPDILVNTPTGGGADFNASYTGLQGPQISDDNYTMTSGSLTVGALPPGGGLDTGGAFFRFTNEASGGVLAEYQYGNWTFFRTENASVVGGPAGPCTQAYVAEVAYFHSFCWWDFEIPLANGSSDALEPHSWNGTWNETPGENWTSDPGCPTPTPGAYVWFDSSLHPGTSGTPPKVTLDLCGQTGNRTLLLLGTARVPVTIWAPLDGRHISASGFLDWYSQMPSTVAPTATYIVPAGWNWTLGSVGPVSAPIDPLAPLPGLVAFERSAC